MANEDLASQSWTNLPPPKFGGGLLSAPQGNRYQQIMSQMKQFNQPMPQGLLDTSGGYNNELYDLTAQQGSAINSFNESINQRFGGSSAAQQASMAAQQAAAEAAFAQLTPGEQAEFNTMRVPNLINFLTPLPVQMLMSVLGVNPVGTSTSGGVSSTSGSPMSGIASKGTVGQVANATTTAQNAANAAAAGNVGTSVGTTGGVSSSSGSPMGGMGSGAAGVAAPSAATGGGGGGGGSSSGTSSSSSGTSSSSSGSGIGGVGTGAAGAAATAAATSGSSSASSGGGGGSGGGSGCCFIMLEARYGDGTMDAVVRRYRDEKITDHNKRGYYKLAEVFVPLMRQSKLFKFMVAKTFADPLVSYGKWHYGQNKHGWIFKPVEKFWMKVFNTLGSDTKFIRENGETV